LFAVRTYTAGREARIASVHRDDMHISCPEKGLREKSVVGGDGDGAATADGDRTVRALV
jgi:hypothetical protein